MTEFAATIRHHSIARAREITVMGNLADAELAAAKEFGSEQRDYEIVIYDVTPGRAPEIISQRKVGGSRWIRSAF